MDFERILEGLREDFGKDLTLQTMIRATTGISTDGGVLIRYLGKWMTFRRPLGLGLRGGVR